MSSDLGPCTYWLVPRLHSELVVVVVDVMVGVVVIVVVVMVVIVVVLSIVQKRILKYKLVHVLSNNCMYYVQYP